MAKLNRKKLLKEPDEFITFSDKAFKWAENHVKFLVIIASAVILVLAGGLGVRAYLDYRGNAAAKALSQSFEQYLAALSGEKDPQKMQAVETGLAKVVSEYGATAAGLQARMALGSLLLENGKWEKAEKIFRDLCEEPELAPELMPLAYSGLAASLEGQKKYHDAAEAYKDAARVAGTSMATLFKLDQARVLAAAGDKAQAEKLYRQVMQANLTPTSSQLARAALVDLGLDPITAAAKAPEASKPEQKTEKSPAAPAPKKAAK